MAFQPNIELLIKAYALSNETVVILEKKVVALEEENARLKELLKLQQQRQFGKKSEVVTTDPEDKPEQTILVAAHTRKKKQRSRSSTLSALPHYQITHDLSPEEKTCAGCQGALHLIGKECTEQLEIIPARYCVIEHIRMKYGCRPCQTVIMAPKPLLPIPKSMAGASVLADIVMNKYQFHQPLYRQSKMMKINGVGIPDNTLGNWTMTIGKALEPVYDAMWIILKANYLQVDETPVKILEPDKKGYVWTYYAPHVGDKKGLVLFEVSETRAGDVAKNRLQPFNGLLQTDAYAGYHSLRERKGIVGLGCFTHARRKFSEVVKISGDKNGLAAEMLGRMKPLYALEARMREAKLSFHTRKRLRQRIARPITQELYRWLCEIRGSVPPKSQLGAAIEYTLNQWKYLIAYLKHGEAEIDTNHVENKIREIALGRKNWLFMGNKESGKIHAIFYSLLLSCTLNDINPRVYIHYVMTKVHDLRRGTLNPEDVLPHTIDRDILQQFIDEQIALAKKLLDSS